MHRQYRVRATRFLHKINPERPRSENRLPQHPRIWIPTFVNQLVEKIRSSSPFSWACKSQLRSRVLFRVDHRLLHGPRLRFFIVVAPSSRGGRTSVMREFEDDVIFNLFPKTKKSSTFLKRMELNGRKDTNLICISRLRIRTRKTTIQSQKCPMCQPIIT